MNEDERDAAGRMQPERRPWETPVLREISVDNTDGGKAFIPAEQLVNTGGGVLTSIGPS